VLKKYVAINLAAKVKQIKKFNCKSFDSFMIYFSMKEAFYQMQAES